MKKVGVLVLGILFICMGILHFAFPEPFIFIMPQNWPVKEELNWIAGLAELLLGLGFIFQRTRLLSGYLICFMLFCFWCLHGIHLVHPPKPEWPFWGYLLRFLLQPFLILLVWKLKDVKRETV